MRIRAQPLSWRSTADGTGCVPGRSCQEDAHRHVRLAVWGKGPEDKVDDNAARRHVKQGPTEGHIVVQAVEAQCIGRRQADLLPEGCS